MNVCANTDSHIIAPVVTASYFDTKDYVRNYGLAFIACSIGAITGNLMAGAAKNTLTGYINVFPYVAMLSMQCIIVVLVLVKPP
ncbi:MAG TPA: hypothetical protein VFM18_11600 [Methanosarcina sp.]|nr:hypothetical protein [Methanosarcina sp.]